MNTFTFLRAFNHIFNSYLLRNTRASIENCLGFMIISSTFIIKYFS